MNLEIESIGNRPQARGFKRTFWDTKEIQHDLEGARKNYMLTVSFLFGYSCQQAIKKLKLWLKNVVFSLMMFFFNSFPWWC